MRKHIKKIFILKMIFQNERNTVYVYKHFRLMSLQTIIIQKVQVTKKQKAQTHFLHDSFICMT